MQEQWKTIDRPYLRKNTYFISNLGNVKREEFTYYAGEYKAKRTQKAGMLSQSTSNTKRSPKGYKFVVIWGADKKQHSLFVHRLVAEYFLPDWDSSLTVNHLDEDTHNNQVSNLEMLSQKENNRASSYHSAKRVPVTLTNTATRRPLYFSSLREAHLFLGISSFVLKNRIRQQKAINGYLPSYSAPIREETSYS